MNKTKQTGLPEKCKHDKFTIRKAKGYLLIRCRKCDWHDWSIE